MQISLSPCWCSQWPAWLGCYGLQAGEVPPPQLAGHRGGERPQSRDCPAFTAS